MIKLLYHPDAGNGAAVTDTHVRHISNLPAKDADLLAVSQSVNTQWAASAFVALLWKTQPNFATEVTAFETTLQNRNTEGGTRPGQTDALETIDIDAEDAVPFVKSYINEKFGPAHGTAHYAEFGLEHRQRHYELPADRQKRSDALRMMIDAVLANGFGAKTYGTAFWTDLKTRYDAALADATTGAGNVSADVSDLVVMRTNLRRVLHSILLILEANYPDTFAQVRRDWGFQKGSY